MIDYTFKDLEEGWFVHNHAWYLLHEIIKLIPGSVKNVLDVGAGTGLAAAVIKAVRPGITVNVCEVDNAGSHYWHLRGLEGKIFDGVKLPYPDNSYDFVMSSHVVEHVDNPADFIKEMWRVARKRLVVAVPDGDCHFADHKTIFNRRNFSEAIEEGTGQKVKIVANYHPHINNLIAVVDKQEGMEIEYKYV